MKTKLDVEKEMENNEMMIYNDDEVSPINLTYLHSMGIIYSKENNKIAIYSTRYARELGGGTYHIKELLKSKGYRWNADEKEWVKEFSEDGLIEAIKILKENDRKALPSNLGYRKCWECGCYSKHLDKNGYCGC